MSEAFGENNWNKLVLWQKRLFGKETKSGLLKTSMATKGDGNSIYHLVCVPVTSGHVGRGLGD